ncbi:MAG: TRAP transporter small permease [Brooklawnia sp.]
MILFSALVAVVTWQVFTRLVMHHPSSWSEEAARYCLVWLSMVGITIAVSERTDVAIDFFVQRLPEVTHRWFDLFVQVCLVVFSFGALVVGGWINATAAMGQRNPVLPFSQGQLYLIVPICGVFMTYFSLSHLVANLLGRYKGFFEEDPETMVEI